MDKAATCTTAGSKSQHCKRCSAKQNVTAIAATGHNYGAPTYVWSPDGKTCTATRVCKTDGSHKETESATITNVVKTAATCTNKGTHTYTATFKNSAFTKQTKDVQDIAALGHVYDDNDICTRCGEKKIWVAGLYDANGDLLVSWADSGIDDTCSNAKTVISEKYPNTTKVVISGNVKEIARDSFYRCKNVESIIIPDGVEKINDAFEYAGIKELVVPDSVTYFNGVKYCDSLTTIKIGSGWKETGSDYKTRFHNQIFLQSHKIENIEVSKDNQYFSSEGGVLYDKAKQYLIWFPGKKSLKNYTMPSTVRTICSYAFSTINTRDKLVLNNGLQYINERAFLGAGMYSITIPSSVKSIGNSAFSQSALSYASFATTTVKASFADRKGWYVYGSKSELLPSALISASQNATWLKETYDNYEWINR